jgi:hypothetical protein
MRPLPPGRDCDEMMQDPAEALVERLLVVESMYAERQERWLGEQDAVLTWLCWIGLSNYLCE